MEINERAVTLDTRIRSGLIRALSTLLALYLPPATAYSPWVTPLLADWIAESVPRQREVSLFHTRTISARDRITTTPLATAPKARLHPPWLKSTTGEQSPSRGMLLVATTEMPDPRFQESVILITEHSSQGTLGLMINRAIGVKIDDLIPNLQYKSATSHYVYFGGPVEINTLRFLARGDKPTERTQHIAADIYLGDDLDALTVALNTRDNDTLRVYAGYAGWAPGQLNLELENGGWHLVRADLDLIFSNEPDNVWPELQRLQPRGILVRYPQIKTRRGDGNLVTLAQ